LCGLNLGEVSVKQSFFRDFQGSKKYRIGLFSILLYLFNLD
jgi:hypothetical protein